MGASYNIFCEDCGYNRGVVYEGVGMMGWDYNYVITPCYKCGVIKQINISTDEMICKKCKSHLEPFDLNKPQHQCPKCGKPTLEVWRWGFWD